MIIFIKRQLVNYGPNLLIIFLITTLFAANTNAQILCDLGKRDVLLLSPTNVEYSGMAYHSDEDIFFMPLDKPISGNIQITAYKDGRTFPIPFQNIDRLNGNDFEGLTYLEEDYFLLLEEDENEIYFLQYFPDEQEFKILSNHLTGIPLGDNPGNNKDGLEGITYDRHTKHLYLVSEHFDAELFSIPITLPGPNNNGSINISRISSKKLPPDIFSDDNDNTENDAAGLFHLGKVVEPNSELVDNILILSEGLKKVVEFNLELGEENKLIDLNPIKESSLKDETKPEGITVFNNQLYIAS